MELRHIHSFLVLAEELQFGRAAARLHISQPSLSLQLQQLERRLGVQLVARTSHRVRLTPAGEAFRREAAQAVGQLDRAVGAARHAGPAAGGHLRIGFNFPAGQRVLVPALSLLRERYPQVRTSLLQRHTCGQLTELRAGKLDIAFIYGAAEVFDDGDAMVVKVASEEIVIFASSVRAETVRMIGLATLSFVDPVPEVTVYATWREQDANPAVPLFLSAVEEASADRTR